MTQNGSPKRGYRLEKGSISIYSSDSLQQQAPIPDPIQLSCTSIPTIPLDVEHIDAENENKIVKQRRKCCGVACSEREPIEAWLLLIRGVIFSVLQGYIFSIFGILYIPYTEEFQATKSKVGWINSITVASLCITSMFISWPMKQLGNSRVTFAVSIFGFLGLTLSAFAPNLPYLYITQGILAGAGACALPLIVAIQQHFTANRTFANGVLMIGLSMGTSSGPYVTEYLYEEYGWRGCLLLMAAITAHRIPLGLTFWAPSSLKPSKDEKTKTTVCQAIIKILKESLDLRLFSSNKIFLLFTIGSVIQGTFITAIFSHLASFAVYRGMSLEQAAFIQSLSFMTAMCIRPWLIVVSNMECTNKMLQYVIGNCVGCMVLVVMLKVPGQIGLILTSVTMGLFIALTYTIHSVLVLEIVGLEKFGKGLGVLSCFTGLIALGATPLCGWIYDVTGWYELAFIVMGIWQACGTLLFAVVCILQWRKTSKQNKDNSNDENYNADEIVGLNADDNSV